MPSVCQFDGAHRAHGEPCRADNNRGSDHCNGINSRKRCFASDHSSPARNLKCRLDLDGKNGTYYGSFRPGRGLPLAITAGAGLPRLGSSPPRCVAQVGPVTMELPREHISDANDGPKAYWRAVRTSVGYFAVGNQARFMRNIARPCGSR